jgi:poly-beta-1,6 N-acetyl-D-glucosamine synthase
VVVNRDVGSIVLLHDAGGDRTMTVAALPQIITQLRDLGYTFTTVSDLSGIPRSKLMPRVTGKDTLLVGADRYVFAVSYIVQRTLTTLFVLSVLLGISRIAFLLVLALIQRYKEKQRVFPAGYAPSVSVVIAAYNEEKVIVRTVEALLASRYPDLEVLVVDDGSKDRTSEVVAEAFGNEPRVRLFRKENGGKASALNRGIVEARGDILVSLDADTLFAPETISRLVRHFADPKVGAVSGNVQVGNTHNLLTRWQALEYVTSQNFDRRAYDLLDCITVVPGAVGALRRTAVLEAGGYTHDTLAEDTDLTWKLHRAGWRIVNDNTAMAYTEAPETLRNLAKQRFRWAFGTLQCLWKHRPALGQHGAFGWIALPSLWLYQILFPAVSPFMDIAMVWALFAGNFAQLGLFYLLMIGIEFIAAAIAIDLERGNPRLLPWLFFQRFVYRQLMYYVVLKSLVAAIRGGAVGWGKFERTGTARIAGKAA